MRTIGNCALESCRAFGMTTPRGSQNRLKHAPSDRLLHGTFRRCADADCAAAIRGDVPRRLRRSDEHGVVVGQALRGYVRLQVMVVTRARCAENRPPGRTEIRRTSSIRPPLSAFLDAAVGSSRTWRMPYAAVDAARESMPKAHAMALRACWCDHSTNPANLASVGGGGADARSHRGIREQGERRIDVGCGDLAKRRQVALQGWHSVCPSVETWSIRY